MATRKGSTAEYEEITLRKVVIGMITSTPLLEAMEVIPNPLRFITVDSARRLAVWTLEYFGKYHKAPGKDIENIYYEKLKAEEFDKELGEMIEENLRDLSDQSKEISEAESSYLIDRTFNFFEAENRRLFREDLDLEEGTDDWYELLAKYEPILKPRKDTGGLSGADLFTEDIAPLTWLVEDLIPHGLIVFGGKSKTGKSYLMLNMVLKLCQDKWMFDDTSDTGFKGEPGSVLYLALEDSVRRLQERVKKIEHKPRLDLLQKYFIVKYTWDPLVRGGLKAIRKWVEEGDNPRLVVIDVMAKVWNKSSKTGGGGQYAEDYYIYGPLADIAHEYGITIIAVTHTVKGKQADPFDEILGGAGTQGPADTLMLLQRHPSEPEKRILGIRGKDTEEKFLEFTVEGEGAEWFCEGSRGEVMKTAERESLYNHLMELAPQSYTEILKDAKEGLIDISPNSVNTILKKMVVDGKLEQTKKYGKYTVAGRNMEKEKVTNRGVAKALKRGKKP